MFKRRFSTGAFNKETAPEKGFFEHCDILRSLVGSSSIMYAPPSGDTGRCPALAGWVNKLQCLIILTSARQCSNVPTPHLAA